MSEYELDAFQAAIGAWQARTFPDGSSAGVLRHLRKELAELEESWQPEEAADMLILLLGFAHRQGFSLADAAQAKFTVLQTRQWGPNVDGIIEHIRAEVHPFYEEAPR